MIFKYLYYIYTCEYLSIVVKLPPRLEKLSKKHNKLGLWAGFCPPFWVNNPHSLSQKWEAQ